MTTGAGPLSSVLAGLAIVLAPTPRALGDSDVPRLLEVRQVTGAQGFEGPRFSLKGDELAFVRHTAAGGLFRMGLASTVPVLTVPGIQFEDPWRFGAEGFSLETAPAVWGQQGWMSVDPSGATTIRRGEDQPVWRGVQIRDHQLEVFVRGEFKRWDLPRDHWRDPAISADGHWIAIVGRSAGLVLVDTWGEPLRYLGPGGRGSFTPDGRWLIYDRLPGGTSDTSDDSADSEAEMGAADLFAYQIGGDRSTALTATQDRAERRPEVSPDGRMVAFDAGGALFVGKLELPRATDDPRPEDAIVPKIPRPPPGRSVPRRP